jgi:hypothetical protein
MGESRYQLKVGLKSRVEGLDLILRAVRGN